MESRMKISKGRKKRRLLTLVSVTKVPENFRFNYLAHENYLEDAQNNGDILKRYAKADHEEKLKLQRRLLKNWKISQLGLNFDLGDAEQSVEKYLIDPTHIVPFNERRLIRHVQEVCPWSAEISRGLSLHIFTTKRGNVLCGHHGEKDKGGLICDLGTTDESRYRVTGTPFARSIAPPKNSKKGVVANVKKPEDREGIMDCGCLQDDVFLDFYWWKLGVVTSLSTGVMEGWRDQRLDPRARAFMVQEWKTSTGLEVNDIYTNNKHELVAEVKRLTKQINTLNSKLEEKKKELKEYQDLTKRQREKKGGSERGTQPH
jgi:hypothetical protein